MDKKEIKEFFDNIASGWDEAQVRDERIITFILDCAGIKQGTSVLDVACGTGVLFPDYESRGVIDLTSIDISEEMTRIAREKFPRARVICDDAESYDFNREFDAVMIYNAFPHFPNPLGIIGALSKCTRAGGRLTVAHSISREHLKLHHSGAAAKVSIDLLDENTLADLMESKGFKVDIKISDNEKYIVSGVRI